MYTPHLARFGAEEIQEQIAEERGYKIVDHSLYMYGVCADCQAKAKK